MHAIINVATKLRVVMGIVFVDLVSKATTVRSRSRVTKKGGFPGQSLISSC